MRRFDHRFIHHHWRSSLRRRLIIRWGPLSGTRYSGPCLSRPVTRHRLHSLLYIEYPPLCWLHRLLYLTSNIFNDSNWLFSRCVIVEPRLYIAIAFHWIESFIRLNGPTRCCRWVGVVATRTAQPEVWEGWAGRVCIVHLHIVFIVLLQLLNVFGCPIDTCIFKLNCWSLSLFLFMFLCKLNIDIGQLHNDLSFLFLLFARIPSSRNNFGCRGSFRLYPCKLQPSKILAFPLPLLAE